MAVLTFLECFAPIDANGLMGTDVHASQTDRTMRANAGFLIYRNIAHRAYLGTCTTPRALIFIHHRMESAQHAVFQEGPSHDAARETPPRIMQLVFLSLDIRDDALQAVSELIEFPYLLIGVTSKRDGAIVRYTNLMRISQLDAFLAQEAPCGP